jgi:hypothetical protein
LKGHAPLTEQAPEPLVADVVDPLGNQEPGQLGQAPGRERQVMIDRTRQRDLLDLAPLGQGEAVRPATGIARVQGVEPIQVAGCAARYGPDRGW